MQQFHLAVVTVFSVFTLSHGSVIKAAPPPFFSSGNPFGGGLISSTSSGISELVAAQEGNAGQTLTLHALGNGLNINLASNVDIDAFTSLAQSGGNSGQNTAEANDSVGTSEIIPQSTIGLEIVGADNIALELDSHATGWEQVSSAAEQEAQVISQQGAGWGVPSGGWGASLQSGRK